MSSKKRYAVSFDLDEGWEQSLLLAADTLEEAQQEAIEILYDFNSSIDPESFYFSICEVSAVHNYCIDEFITKWEALEQEGAEAMKQYYEKRERDEFERLKRKYQNG